MEGAKIMSNKSKRGGQGRPNGSGPDVSDIWADYSPPRIDTTGPALVEDRMPLFYVDGVEHSAPARVPAYLAVQAIRVAALRGPEAATWHMVENALDPESIKVLETSEHVSYEDAQVIFTQLGRLYYGQMEAVRGK